MSVQPIAPSPSSPLGSPGADRSPSGALGSFERVLTHLLDHPAREQAQAIQAVEDIALGKNDDVHDAAMAVARSDISFRMVLEVRNRLEQAYQEVMRMQV
jgi:flagellar hook-basal body complex protein FliE